MERAKLLRAGIFVAALAATGLGGARASVITLDVSATFTPSFFPATCSPTCTLGGDIVIDNSPGAANSGFVSADVTASGVSSSLPPSPSVGPFTIFDGVSTESGSLNTGLRLADALGDALALGLNTPTAGSLVDYTGGPLPGAGSVMAEGGSVTWLQSSGSLTAVPAPAIGSGLPVAMAFGGVLLAARLLRRTKKPRSLGQPA